MVAIEYFMTAEKKNAYKERALECGGMEEDIFLITKMYDIIRRV